MTFNRIDPGQVRRLAEALHAAEIGCRIEPVVEAESYGTACNADHERQATLLLQALVHSHDF